MSMKVQRSIWRPNMGCPTYSRVTTGQPLIYRWCCQNFSRCFTVSIFVYGRFSYIVFGYNFINCRKVFACHFYNNFFTQF